MDKGNVFIVFMPFQLYVAQQIIKQENLKNCILVDGYRSLFAKTYDLIIIEELWHSRINFEKIALFTGEELQFPRNIYQTFCNYRKFLDVLRKYNISDIYIGEVKNQGLRFLARSFSHKGYKINYFEEGTSHYNFIPEPIKRDAKIKVKEYIKDIFYYLPLYHIRYAKWEYNRCLPIENIKINKRFSIIPGYFNEKFDVQLKPQILTSKKMRKYLDNTFSEPIGNYILFMTDPIEEYLGEKWKKILEYAIKKSFKTIDNNTYIILKFHHRDSDELKSFVQKCLNDLNFKYVVLASRVNIPVEFYLQKFNFDRIIFINASTFFYNGYVYPQTNFTSILPYIYEKSKELNIDKNGLIWMQNILNMMNKICVINSK